MQLPPPIEQYLQGDKPSHTSRAGLSRHITFLKAEETNKLLIEAGYLSIQGKPTPKAFEEEVAEACDGKALWHVKRTQKALLALTRKESKPRAANPALTAPKAPIRPNGPIWTDLDSIGTYFGVGKVKVGKWLDEIGLRAAPEKQINDSGDYDMLDFANESKQKFSSKRPTQRALDMGIAQITEVTKGDKIFEIIKWNLDECKAALVKAGHPLDLEKKMILKGKGKNSNVEVHSLVDRAKKIHGEWRKLSKASPRDAHKLIDKQPKPILVELDKLEGYPGFFTAKKYKTAK